MSEDRIDIALAEAYEGGLSAAKSRITELEAELTIRREQAEGLQNQWVKDTQKIVALEAEVMEFKSRGNVAMSSWDEERERALREGERVVALEAEVKTLRKSGIGLIGILEEILYAVSIDKSCNARVRTIAATLEQQIKAVRDVK